MFSKRTFILRYLYSFAWLISTSRIKNSSSKSKSKCESWSEASVLLVSTSKAWVAGLSAAGAHLCSPQAARARAFNENWKQEAVVPRLAQTSWLCHTGFTDLCGAVFSWDGSEMWKCELDLNTFALKEPLKSRLPQLTLQVLLWQSICSSFH